MHLPLDSYLHGKSRCQELVEALMRCHAERSKIAQMFGACNDEYEAMRRCTKKERLELEEIKKQETKVKGAKRYMERLEEMETGRPWQDLLREKLERDYQKQKERQRQKQEQQQQKSEE